MKVDTKIALATFLIVDIIIISYTHKINNSKYYYQERKNLP